MKKSVEMDVNKLQQLYKVKTFKLPTGSSVKIAGKEATAEVQHPLTESCITACPRSPGFRCPSTSSQPPAGCSCRCMHMCARSPAWSSARLVPTESLLQMLCCTQCVYQTCPFLVVPCCACTATCRFAFAGTTLTPRKICCACCACLHNQPRHLPHSPVLL